MTAIFSPPPPPLPPCLFYPWLYPSPSPPPCSLSVVFITFSCISYAMPFILCATICCCLPCIITLMGFDDDAVTATKGAPPDAIASLPTFKYRVRRRSRAASGNLPAGAAGAAATVGAGDGADLCDSARRGVVPGSCRRTDSSSSLTGGNLPGSSEGIGKRRRRREGGADGSPRSPDSDISSEGDIVNDESGVDRGGWSCNRDGRGWRGGEGEGRGLRRSGSTGGGGDSDTDSVESDELGLLWAGTAKERVVEGEDAVSVRYVRYTRLDPTA